VTSSTAARSRPQVATGWTANSVVFWGFGSPGDSGSPLVGPDGQAYAILTHGITPYGSPELWGTNIQRALSLARGAGFNINVVTADFIL
jgi:S1-C subfamily serine protease